MCLNRTRAVYYSLLYSHLYAISGEVNDRVTVWCFVQKKANAMSKETPNMQNEGTNVSLRRLFISLLFVVSAAAVVIQLATVKDFLAQTDIDFIMCCAKPAGSGISAARLRWVLFHELAEVLSAFAARVQEAKHAEEGGEHLALVG